VDVEDEQNTGGTEATPAGPPDDQGGAAQPSPPAPGGQAPATAPAPVHPQPTTPSPATAGPQPTPGSPASAGPQPTTTSAAPTGGSPEPPHAEPTPVTVTPLPGQWWDGYRWQPPPGGYPGTTAGLSSAAPPYGQQTPAGPAWWWDGYRWQPYPAQWPAAPLPPAAAGATGGAAARPVFGVTPRTRPTQVPWTWREVLVALLVSVAPIVALSALSVLSGSSAGESKPTTAFALFTIVLTLIVDGWFVLWAWFFSLRKYRLPWRSFGFKGYEEGSAWAIAAGVIAGGLFATYLLSGLNDYVYRKVIGPVPDQNVVTIFPHVPAGLVLFIVLAVFVAPVLEETFFRGFVFQGLGNSWGPVVGAIVSALIFSLTHQQLSVLVPIFALGALLAAAFYWTRSIYTNMAMHAIFNLLGVLAWWFLT